MFYGDYYTDKRTQFNYAIISQVIRRFFGIKLLQPSGPLKLVGPCALHNLHNPLLRHCVWQNHGFANVKCNEFAKPWFCHTTVSTQLLLLF